VGEKQKDGDARGSEKLNGEHTVGRFGSPKHPHQPGPDGGQEKGDAKQTQGLHDTSDNRVRPVISPILEGCTEKGGHAGFDCAQLVADGKPPVEGVNGQMVCFQIGAESPGKEAHHVGHEDLRRSPPEAQRITDQTRMDGKAGMQSAPCHIEPAPQRLNAEEGNKAEQTSRAEPERGRIQ